MGNQTCPGCRELVTARRQRKKRQSNVVCLTGGINRECQHQQISPAPPVDHKYRENGALYKLNTDCIS